MAEPSEPSSDQPESKPEPTKYKSSEVLSIVAERLGSSGTAVRERVIDTLVEREVVSRVEVLDKGLAKRSEYERELRKISKPDVETYDAEGKPVSATYSKARIDELKKSREQLTKLEGAIDKALVSNDFSKLREIVGK